MYIQIFSKYDFLKLTGRDVVLGVLFNLLPLLLPDLERFGDNLKKGKFQKFHFYTHVGEKSPGARLSSLTLSSKRFMASFKVLRKVLHVAVTI